MSEVIYMKSLDIHCDACDTSFQIMHTQKDREIEFCPICGNDMLDLHKDEEIEEREYLEKPDHDDKFEDEEDIENAGLGHF